MKNIGIEIVVLLSSLLFGCVTKPVVTMTPLEIQSMQTREYEASINVVFPSVMSVFQDLGYTITNADKDTGLISAESPAVSDDSMRVWTGITKVSQTKSTAFIERIKNVTKVRLSFVTTNDKSYAQGQVDREDKPILKASIYQNAFERIESAIFIRSANKKAAEKVR